MIVLPHPEYEAILQRILRIRPLFVTWRGVGYRSVRPKYWQSGDFLRGDGSRIHGGRWNPPDSFAAVYLSLSFETAVLEFRATWERYRLPAESALPRVFAAASVELTRVLDLADGAIRQRLLVSEERMVTSDWNRANDRGNESVSQAVGRACFEAGLEGVIVPSARHREGRNVVIFPDNLLPDSVLREQLDGTTIA